LKFEKLRLKKKAKVPYLLNNVRVAVAHVEKLVIEKNIVGN
jgi:hypothetical protein